MYLDLDIITIAELVQQKDGVKVPMGRFAAVEDGSNINNAAMRFPMHDPFLWDLMEDFVTHVLKNRFIYLTNLF